jgi:hypothetical protein
VGDDLGNSGTFAQWSCAAGLIECMGETARVPLSLIRPPA